MGYLTTFTLNIIRGDLAIDYQEEIEEMSGYGDETFNNQIKWYDYENDMKRISKKYPEVIFCLRGYGEEPGDLWMRYFKNGKIQHSKGKVVFDEFDESKLK